MYGLTVMDMNDPSGLKPGMAGGPVLDSAGRMIGINSANVNGTTTAHYVPV